MGEDARAIEEEIRAERNDLGRNIDDLQRRTEALTDWRTHYRRNAGATLAVAFGGGMALGLLARTPINRPQTEQPAVEPPRSVGFSPLKAIGENPRVRQQVGDACDEILEALIAVASARAVEFLASVVPGFRDEYDAHRGRRVGPVDRVTVSDR